MADPVRPPDFLVHREGDAVAVAIRDLKTGPAEGAYLRGPASVSTDVREEIPLGHKLALADIAEGQDVIEYGQRVGVATKNISRGEHVHVHNLRSARWQSSVA